MESWKKIIVFGLIAILSVNTAIVSFGAERNYGYEDPFETPALTGNWRTDIIAVAKSQVGYKEAEDGSTYFGEWIGEGEATQGWCSEFASWCAYKAGIPKTIFPRKRSSNAFQEFFYKKGRFFFLEGGICPEESGYRKSNAKTISLKELKIGDILLVDTNSDYGDGADHTALVISHEDGLINAVSGNVNNAVLEKPYFPERIHGVCRPAYEKNQNHDLDSSTATKSDVSHSSNSSSGTGSGGGGSGGGERKSSSSSTGPGASSLQTTGISLYLGLWEMDEQFWKLRIGQNQYAQSQWAMIDGKWYIFNQDGHMLTGWQNIDNCWYMLNHDGAMLTGWFLYGGKWYYLMPDGSMAKGWIYVNNHWYCFAADGTMYSSTITPDGYLVNADGEWIEGVNAMLH